MKKKSMESVKGENPEEKFASLGISRNKSYDVLELIKIHKVYSVDVVLYFEPDLAKNSTYEKDLVEFKNYPEFERPFILAEKFIEFGKENDPTFEGRLSEFPLMITVLDFGELVLKSPAKKYYIKGIMPFADEFDVDKEPGPFIE
ncbi:hypothetical protein F1737_04095 [Methanoplanus sp. FWC-SCC4]|uniref:Uncharacterized protein n=1 Tax=Methanochimaera problematica TaxID=2609417 RepID=A0AA97FEG8_9EURY|nr:hypothetical protein [Methanoplanus sp. FWC-SCC4]WOF15936.1 hypothetical protein F1737_04095 [Methanoplanus sp. FWC-SCC4]